ncbi:MAG: hypothetical protein JXB50_03285 [Spirochaetes bacterium]|nr:hypothetical protein [Spirochaetota bacterium]
MEKNFDEAYRIFSRVIMIYPIKKLKEMINMDAGYEIENISYLNPKEIEKDAYKVIIKNNVLTLKNYHENIRFVISIKDLLIIKNILKKKGYTDHIRFLIEILKKSAIGMSVISGKKINSIFSAGDIDNAYNLGHEEKFLFFKYRINIDTFPPFFISLIIHEAVIEYLKEEFINEVRIDLPYLNFTRFFSQGFINYFDSVIKGCYYFYPEDIKITEYISFRQYGLNKYASLY